MTLHNILWLFHIRQTKYIQFDLNSLLFGAIMEWWCCGSATGGGFFHFRQSDEPRFLSLTVFSSLPSTRISPLYHLTTFHSVDNKLPVNFLFMDWLDKKKKEARKPIKKGRSSSSHSLPLTLRPSDLDRLTLRLSCHCLPERKAFAYFQLLRAETTIDPKLPVLLILSTLDPFLFLPERHRLRHLLEIPWPPMRTS